MTDRLISLLTLAVMIGFSACLPAAPQINQPAPGFEVIDTAGGTHTLSDYAGKTVILEWSNHECPFVAKHYNSGNMQKQQRMARDKHDVVWLTVISSKPDSQGHVTSAQADELTRSRDAYPSAVLLDESGDMGRAYDARVTPHMYIIDADGVLRYMGGIDSIPSADIDDLADAKQYVVAALDQMAAGDDITDAVTRPYGCTIKY